MPTGLTPLFRGTEFFLPSSRFPAYSEASSLEAQPLNGDEEGFPVSELVDLPLNVEDDDALHRPHDEDDDGEGEGCGSVLSLGAGKSGRIAAIDICGRGCVCWGAVLGVL